jgi:hypothetical protein
MTGRPIHATRRRMKRVRNPTPVSYVATHVTRTDQPILHGGQATHRTYPSPRRTAAPRAVINWASRCRPLQETADVRVADPYIYASALAGRLSASAAERASGRASHGRLAPMVSLDSQLESRPLVTSVG